MPENIEKNTKLCPICGETINANAIKCIECGEFIEGYSAWKRSNWFGLKYKSIWDLAGLLIIPFTLTVLSLGFSWYQKWEETQRDNEFRMEDQGTSQSREVTRAAQAARTIAANEVTQAVQQTQTAQAISKNGTVEAVSILRAIEAIKATQGAEAVRAVNMEATFQAIRVARTVEHTRLETAEANGTAPAITFSEVSATAQAINAVDGIIEAQVAEVTHVAVALETAVMAEIIRGGEAADAIRTAQAIEATRAAQVVIALNSEKTAEAIRAVEANATATEVAAIEAANAAAKATTQAEAIMTVEAAQATGTAQVMEATQTAQAVGTAQAVIEATQAAQATETAQAMQATQTAQAMQATQTTQAMQATQTAQAQPTPTATPTPTPTPLILNDIVIEVENPTGQLDGEGEAADYSWTETDVDEQCSNNDNIALQAAPAEPSLNTGFETIGPALLYEIPFGAPNEYFLYVRGMAASGTQDSILIGLREPETNDPILITDSGFGLDGFVPRFTWRTYQYGDDLITPIIRIPAAGTYTLYIWMREAGVVIDKILLTTTQGKVEIDSTMCDPPESQ